jgi:nucleoside-diphosphate-sugar epimerase
VRSTCVVTGANGRVGRLLCPALAELGFPVVPVDRMTGTNYNTLECDLSRSPLTPAIAASDSLALVHLAAIPSPRKHQYHELLDNNVNSAFNAARLMADPRLTAVVVLSSEAVYGAAYEPPIEYNGWRFPLDEKSPVRATDPYGLSKLATELIFLQMWKSRPDLSLFILRSCYMIFPQPQGDQLQFLKEGAGYAKTKLFSYAYVSFVISGVVSCLSTRLPGRHILNVAERENILRCPLTELISNHFPGAQVRSPLDFRHPPDAAPVNSTRLRNLLSYKE